MDGILALLSLWLLAIGIALALRFLYRKLLTRRRSSTSKSPRLRAIGHVRRETSKALIILLNGDRNTADRLLQQARFQHPGKSENWYWEKVIYDLRRDRRS